MSITRRTDRALAGGRIGELETIGAVNAEDMAVDH
jgi:hypothetical protein